MALHLIRGRGTGSTAQRQGQRHHAHLPLGLRSLRPLLFDARLLSPTHTALETQSVELRQLLRQVYRRFAPIAQRQHILLTLQLPSPPPEVHGPPVVLDWIFSTFVGYALSDTRVRTEVALTAVVHTNCTCSIHVTSTSLPSTPSLFPARWNKDDRTHPAIHLIEEHSWFLVARSLLASCGGAITVKRNGIPGTDIIVTLPLLT